ncbi:hypothetical protein [Clostridium sp. LP20]|uniref:hypothetical protein n=1 Tax=Clostridium sp. LP20 TaxID=3418665 RepID=UPI003EE7981B
MGIRDDMLITYGIGYVFNNNKLLGIWKCGEKTISEEELSIEEEINQLNGRFAEVIKEENRYIKKVEEVLEEKYSVAIPLIVSIKYLDTMRINEEKMEEYTNKHFIRKRYKENKYFIKDLSCAKEYFDKVEELGGKVISYDKVTFKLILTTSFGDKLLDFINSLGKTSNISDGEKYRRIEFETSMGKNSIFQIEYRQIDFSNLLLQILNWENSYFSWQGDIEDILILVDEQGNVVDSAEKGYKLKDHIVRFIKGKNYLYIPFARVNEENILVTMDFERYLREKNKFFRILSKEGTYIFDPTPIEVRDNNFIIENEVGFLMKCKDEKVTISVGAYRKDKKRVLAGYELDALKEIMKESIKKFIE